MRGSIKYAQVYGGLQLPVTPEKLSVAYRNGMLRKAKLKDGRYYLGHCRNAEVAQWDHSSQRFFHVRTKWGNRFVESIPHPEDCQGYDVFTPFKTVKPRPDQVVRSRPCVRY